MDNVSHGQKEKRHQNPILLSYPFQRYVTKIRLALELPSLSVGKYTPASQGLNRMKNHPYTSCSYAYESWLYPYLCSIKKKKVRGIHLLLINEVIAAVRYKTWGKTSKDLQKSPQSFLLLYSGLHSLALTVLELLLLAWTSNQTVSIFFKNISGSH